MSETLACLSLSPLFRDLDPALLADLAGNARRLELASGGVLFNYGDEGDALYVVATGRLRASIDTSGVKVVIGDAGRGEVVGEMALITGEARTATVRAVRDSVLIRLGKKDVESLLDRHPAAVMDLARLIMLRLSMHGRQRKRDGLRSTRTLALMPAHTGLPMLPMLASELVRGLGASGAVRLLDSGTVESELGTGYANTPFGHNEQNSLLVNWLNALEAEQRYLVYQGDADMSAWSRRCLRQADRIILVADASNAPEVGECAAFIRDQAIQTPVELVLVHPGSRIGAVASMEWCKSCAAITHHHVIQPLGADIARLVRLMTGQAVGVVFGGGGARGFAHLGLVRALSEHGLQPDIVGGTSIGALFGALVAQGRTADDVRQELTDLFVRKNYLNDYSLARVSLIRGRKFRGQLERLFGEARIEDLPIGYFCISTNLTRGAAVIHKQGRLSEWVASSMTIPGIGPPVVWQGDLLVDGGLINNVPTDVMQDMGRGHVIASDVSNAVELRVENVDSNEPRDLLSYKAAAKSFNLAKILFRAATLVSEDQVSARRANADVYLRMPVEGVGTFDWEAAKALEARAFDYASAELERYFNATPGDGAG